MTYHADADDDDANDGDVDSDISDVNDDNERIKSSVVLAD